jgi:hypothetical protein
MSPPYELLSIEEFFIENSSKSKLKIIREFGRALGIVGKSLSK